MTTAPTFPWAIPFFGTRTSIDYAELSPTFMAMVGDGSPSASPPITSSAFTYSAGTSETAWFAGSVDPSGYASATGGGTIAASANASSVVWNPGGMGPFYSTTNGSSWTASTGIPAGGIVASDRVNPLEYYDYAAGQFYVSVNGGVSFTATTATGLPAAGDNVNIKAVPGITGDVWLAGGSTAAGDVYGLWHSTNAGASFTKLANVTQADSIGFGKAGPGASYPTLFTNAEIGGVRGIYASTNEGVTWTLINDPAHQYGLAGYTITGDPQIFGTVYLGTNGRGIIMGTGTPPVTPVTGFTLTPSAPTLSVTQGSSATDTITVTPIGGFTGTVTFTASGLPTGVTASFSGDVVTFAASSTAATGPATVTITGTSGTLSSPTTISLTVNPSANFSLSATAASVTQGGTGTSTITVTPTGGFTGTVTYTAAGLPTGVTVTFSGNTATFTASTTATTGAVTVTITGTSGTLSHTATLTLTVNPSANFSLSATAASVTQGGTGTSTITVTPTGGFTGTVTYTASGLPTGVTVSFSGNTATFTASTTAATGAATVTITGTSGTLSHTATLTLTVNPSANFSLSATAASVTQGGTGTSTITVTPTGGFTGTVTYTASGLPAGITVSFSGNTATFTASTTATTGAATVTITGTSGTLSHTATLTLTVNPSANFSLSATAASVAPGGTGTSTITVTPTGGFAGTVTYTASGLPTGVTAGFSGNTVTFTASTTAATGSFTVTITGTSGTLSHTTTVALTVTSGNGGVTVTPVINSNSPYFDDEGIKLSNTASITALSITITIQNTGGLSYSGEYNTVGGSIAQSHSSTASAITYQYSLASGQTLGAGSGWLFDAQAGGSGTAHAATGDTFSVTYTTGGQSYTQTGNF